MATRSEPQFTIEQLEEKVLRMVEIAALTCEKLSSIKPDVEQESIASLGTEYISLARDIKIALKEHVLRISDVPVTSSPANALKDHRELETWALKTEMVLKQLSVISATFSTTLSDSEMQTESSS